jgi:hypothetical protein
LPPTIAALRVRLDHRMRSLPRRPHDSSRYRAVLRLAAAISTYCLSTPASLREAGASWTVRKGDFEQPAANEHAAFMSGLADKGFVMFARPLVGLNATASEFF